MVAQNVMFPKSWTPQQCVDAIQNPKKIIKINKPNQDKFSFRITSQIDIEFDMHLTQEGNLTFYPYKGNK